MLRYGTLFASAFLEGIGSGFQSAASTSVPIGATGLNLTVAHPPNPAQAAMIGVGQVGTKWGQNVGSLANRLPTIKIAGGTGVGILLTQDFQLPGPVLNNKNNNK